jgi:hypothetical protein
MLCFYLLMLAFIVIANILLTQQKTQQQGTENVYLEEEFN